MTTLGHWRTPGGHNASFVYREDTNCWNTLTSSLTNDEYDLPQNMEGVAVDVGGYLGSVGIALALDNPAMSVTIVEPVPDNQRLIMENIQLNDVCERVKLISGAVGKGGEPVEVRYDFRDGGALEHHRNVGNASIAWGVDVPHKTVTYTGLGLASFGHIDFLKIDCEGGEWAFLSDGAPNVGRIMGEAHAVMGHRGRDIIGLLKATHRVELSNLQDGYPDGTCGFAAVPR